MKKRKIAKAALAVLSMMSISAAGAAFAACDKDDDKHTHDYGAWTLITNPTLDTNGTAERYCKDDDGGKETKTDVPKLSDTSVWTENVSAKVDPTHTTTGSREFTSTDYGTVTITLPVNADAHNYGGWTLTKDPTETEVGTATRVCGDNSSHVETKTDVPVLTDKSVWTVDNEKSAAATHTQKGKTVYTSVYGTVTVDIPANANAHTYGGWTLTKDPTETEVGTATRVCDDDSTHVETKTDVPILTDKSVWTVDSEKSVAATHTQKGKTVYTSVYGTVTVDIPADANAHTYGDWTVVTGNVPDLEKGGKVERVCGGDSTHKETENVTALSDADSWTMEVKTPATHQAAGVADYTHKTFGVKITGVAIAKQEHTFGAWKITTEPTKTGKGEATRVCSEIEGDCKDDATATQTFELPELDDTTFWTHTTTAANLNSGTVDEYTNATYGTVKLVADDKVAAPYDDGEYYCLQLDVHDTLSITKRDNLYGEPILSLNKAKGEGTMFPVAGKKVVINSKNPTTFTGEIEFVIDGVAYDAYYDEDSDIIVVIDSASCFYVFTPYSKTGTTTKTNEETGEPEQIEISVAKDVTNRGMINVGSDTLVLLDYDYAEGKNIGILIKDGEVTFNLTFRDLFGEPADLTKLDEGSGLYIYDAEEELVAGYAMSLATEKWATVDGLQGVYKFDHEAEVEPGNVQTMHCVLVVNGVDKVTLYQSEDMDPRYSLTAQYTVLSNTEDEKIVGTIMGDTGHENYFEFTLHGDGMGENGGTADMEIPTVTVTYEFGDYQPTNGVSASKVVNKNIAFALDTLEHSEMYFVGWYTDAECTQPVTLKDEKFTPTDDVTLYAKWAEKATFTLKTDLNSDGVEVHFGVGEQVGKYLPEYNIDEINERLFVGWYVNINGTETEVTANMPLSAANEGMVIYGKWNPLPASYGEYKLVVANNESTIVSGYTWTDKEFAISVLGEITGDITGQIDESTLSSNKIVCSNGSKTFTLFFDANSGIMVADRSDFGTINTFDANDVFIGIKNVYSVASVKTYAVHVDNQYRFDARFVAYNGHTVLLYNGEMITDFYVKNTAGTDLTIDDIKNSKTIVVTSASGELLFARASTADSFNGGKTTVPIDEYFGTYIGSSDEMFLSGAGEITWGVKTGTYSVSESGADYTLDVYLENESEYYRVTLDTDNDTYTYVKPVVTITFNAGDNSTVEADENANVNIVYTLPTPESSVDEVFRGWYLDDTYTNKVPENWKPTESIEIFAQWDAKASVNFHYNDNDNDTPHSATAYGDGYVNDKIGVVNVPTVDFSNGDKVFVGWFTKDGTDSDWGEEVTGDTVITNVTFDVYAKWSEPHALYGTYSGVDAYYFGSSGSIGVAGQVSNALSPGKSLTIGADGTIIAISSGTGSSVGDTVEYDEVAGTVKLKPASGNPRFGYADAENGIIIYNFKADSSEALSSDLLIMMRGTGNTIAKADMSYWESLNSLLFTVKNDGKSTHVFLHDGKIYYNVSYSTSTGGTLAAGNAYNQDDLKVFEADGTTLIAEFIKVNGSLKEPDGYQNTYTGSGADMVLNGGGSIIWGEKSGTYSLAEEGADYTLDVYLNNETEYVRVTLDTSAKTYTFDKPVVAISFDAGSYATVADDENANINVVYALPTPTNETYIFMGWFFDDVFENAVPENWKPTEDITLYAKFIIPAAMTGTYKGWNLYKNNEVDNKIIASLSSSITISAGGEYNKGFQLDRAGKLSDEHMYVEDGAINVGRYAYVNKSVGVIWYAYSSNASSVANDTCILFNPEVVTSVDYSGIKGPSSYIFWATLELNVTEKTKVNILGFNNVIYTNVNWGSTSAKDCSKASLVVTASDGSIISAFKAGVPVDLDGYQGTYEANETTIVIDGCGTIKVADSTPDSYDIVDGKILFVHQNQMHTITVNKDNGTFAYVQDGYAGEYTLPDEAGTITLDGLGGAGSGKTYVVSGTQITIYDGASSTKYGLDVDNKQFLGKSKFAGLSFFKDGKTTDDSNKIVFEDDSEIKGRMYCGYSTWTIDFIGELQGDILTLTIKSETGTGAAVGSTFKLQITGDTMKITEINGSTSGNWQYVSVAVGWSYTCAGFSIAG